MNYPVKKIFITQKWGVNEEIYKRFGFKGHNGLDLRLFDDTGNRSSTSLVYAPHDGVVRERRFDANGYGNYLKIQSDTEGSILGHLKEFNVGVNKHVKEGDLVGIADNTGWSTGSHLHWGYYKQPRNRANGYGGTIDPIPHIAPLPTTENPMPTKTLLEHIKVKDDAEGIKVWDQEKAFLEGERKKNTELTDKLGTCQENLKKETGVSNDRKKELEEIAYLLGPEVTVETTRRNVEEIISRESGYIQQVVKLEKAVEERDNKIIAQKLKQETELNRLQEKIEQMEKKHSLELDRLKEQVGNVQQQVGDTNKQEADNNVFKKLLDKIKLFIMKY